MTLHLSDGWETVGFRVTPDEAGLLARIDDGIDPAALSADEREAVARWIAHGIVEVEE